MAGRAALIHARLPTPFDAGVRPPSPPPHASTNMTSFALGRTSALAPSGALQRADSCTTGRLLAAWQDGARRSRARLCDHHVSRGCCGGHPLVTGEQLAGERLRERDVLRVICREV